MLIEEVQHYAHLELLARKAKEGFITGIHSSPFHGFSVEFAEHRPYNAGESIRYLDWKLLARTDKKYIKQFNEETNLRANLWVDISGSMKYPAENPLKLKFSCLAAATLSLLFQQQKDAFSIGLFNEKGFVYKQPIKSTLSHWQQAVGMLQAQWDNSTEGNQYPFENNPISIDELSMQVYRRSLVLLFSDLLFGGENTQESNNFWKSIAFLKFLKCEIVIFHVFHQPTEIDLSVENRPTRFVDLETGTSIKLQPEEIQSAYSNAQYSWLKKIKDKLTEQDIEYIACDIAQPIDHVLKSFFTRRRRN
ncbi:MAG: hypothetical protein RLZZ252_1572 [Bacteroidota bacterium]|jgi:hypothetical protein